MAFVTWQDTVSDGNQTDYTIIFPYLSSDHVKISFNGAVQDSSSYSFFTSTTIRLNTAAPAGTTVRVYRDTPQSVLTDFKDGYLPESELDNAYLQNLYHIQELQDKWDDAVANTLTEFVVTTLLQDADGDTWINVEQSADEDIIRASKLFWIKTGASGHTGGPWPGADQCVIENSAGVGMTFMCPATNSATIAFGDEGSNIDGFIQYSHSLRGLIFGAGAFERFRVRTNEVAVNEASNTVDFRWENDASIYGLMCDASQNRIGITNAAGLTPTDGLLHIQSGSAGAVAASASIDELVLESSGDCGLTILAGNTSLGSIAFGDTGSNTQGLIQYDFTSEFLRISSGGVEGIRVDTSAVTINEASANLDFRVESDTGTHLLFCDASSNTVHIGNALNTGAAGGNMVFANTNGIQFINNAGTSSANFGVSSDSSDNLNLNVPGADSINFVFAGTLRGYFNNENSGMGLMFQGESSSDHSAPPANDAIVYTKDNGSGKTQLCVRFNTGAVQVLATEP